MQAYILTFMFRLLYYTDNIGRGKAAYTKREVCSDECLDYVDLITYMPNEGA